MKEFAHIRIETPLGYLRITGHQKGICAVEFLDEDVEQSALPCLRQAAEQITEYFEGKRNHFDSLPLLFMGTTFQITVWEQAMHIPFGEVVQYADMAKGIQNPKAARAIGNALNKNPLLIIVPCHRIVPRNGSRMQCGGFAAGGWRKSWLLEHELQHKKTET